MDEGGGRRGAERRRADRDGRDGRLRGARDDSSVEAVAVVPAGRVGGDCVDAQNAGVGQLVASSPLARDKLRFSASLVVMALDLALLRRQAQGVAGRACCGRS